MNPNDYRTMIECAESRRAEIAMRCMGEMGLRVSETNFKMEDIRESSHQEVDIVFLTIYGKDSTGKSDDGKRRDVWMPRNLYERLQMYQKNENLSDHHPILPFSTRTISRDVKESAKNAALKTGDEDYNYISCHDFRAYFATNMLLREGVDVEIVMELGGWVDRKTMAPYLNASFDDIIQGGLAEAGVLSDDVDIDPSEIQLILKQLEEIKEAINEIDASIFSNDVPEDQSGLLDF
jgi:integrase